MNEGVLFGDKHSFRDWGLHLASRPVISPPVPKLNLIEIPGTDERIDLTEAVSGEVNYESRELTFEFEVIQRKGSWPSIQSEIMNYLHGKKMKIILDEDTEWFWEGRLYVDDWSSHVADSIITIKANVEPYKWHTTTTGGDWLWGPLSFHDGVIQDYKDLEISGSTTVYVYNSRKRVVPEIIVSDITVDNVKVRYAGKTYSLKVGSNVFPELMLQEGKTAMVFSGDHAKVTIVYRMGSL